MSDKDVSSTGRLEQELGEYRQVLMKEVRTHRQFSRIAILTGCGLLVGGVVTLYYYAPLGWLLVIVAVLRVLNSLYDLQREDELQRRLRQLEDRFGRRKDF